MSGLFERVFDEAHAEGHGSATGVELYERTGVTVEIGEDEAGLRVSESRERGLAIRLFRGGRVSFAASGPAGAHRLAASAFHGLPRSRARRMARTPSLQPGETRSATGSAPEPRDEEVLAVLAAFRKGLFEAGKGAAVLREASVTAGERVERIRTSTGRDASYGARSASLLATVIGRIGSERFSARVVALASSLEALPVARLARHAADRVLLPLTGKRAPAGRSELLLDSHVAAHLVGRLAPLFFGDERETLLAARTRDGRDALTSPVISLVDSASAAGGPVQTSRDGEGTPQARTLLVDGGRVVGRLADTFAAARLSIPPTGNAIRATWGSPPAIGVTNFHVDPAPGVSPLDLLSSVTRGVYAGVLLEKPVVDLAADRFRLVAAGWAIERGRAAGRLSEIVAEGRLSELLRAVEAIGDDLKFAAGAGGGVGSPTLLVRRWKLG